MASALPITSGPQTYGAADSIVPASAIGRDAGYRAIDTIHASIDWSLHNATVKRYLGRALTGDATIAFLFHKTIAGVVDGYVIMRKDESKGADYGYIPYIAVDPKSQGKGIGVSLMAAAIEKTREMGLKFLHLEYRSNKEKLTKFYEKSVPTTTGIVITENIVSGCFFNGDPRKSITYDVSKS